MRINRSLATSGVLVAILTTFAAGPASAHPVGCAMYTPAISASASGYMTGAVSATCNNAETRTVYAEIKWNKSAAPDPLVAKNSVRKSDTSYKPKVSTCDNGNRRSYYSRGYFGTTASDHRDSATRTITTCG